MDEHQAAAITGAIAIQDGKAFVAVQGLNEEGTGGRGQTPCCTFRGNLNALDVNTGAFLWKTYTVDEPKLRGRNTRSGQDAFGPAGGGIWSSPTVDVKRRAVYVSTGNAYADPPQPMTDAVIAMNIDTGKIMWVYQATPNDNWLGGCGARGDGNPGCPGDERSRSRLLGAAGPDHRERAPADRDSAEVGDGLRTRSGQAGRARVADALRTGQRAGWRVGWRGRRTARVLRQWATIRRRRPAASARSTSRPAQSVWSAPPPQPRLCDGKPRCNASQGGATTAIPGAVIAVSLDGGLRAYATADGKILWQFDTNAASTRSTA